MTSGQRGLLDIIRQFKPDDISDLEAALNVIGNHAATIKGLINENDRLQGLLSEVRAIAARSIVMRDPNAKAKTR